MKDLDCFHVALDNPQDFIKYLKVLSINTSLHGSADKDGLSLATTDPSRQLSISFLLPPPAFVYYDRGLEDHNPVIFQVKIYELIEALQACSALLDFKNDSVLETTNTVSFSIAETSDFRTLRLVFNTEDIKLQFDLKLLQLQEADCLKPTLNFSQPTCFWTLNVL